MKRIVALMIFLLLAGSASAQEDVQCTLVLDAETGVFVAENCTQVDFQELVVNFGEVTVTYEATLVEEIESASDWVRFQPGTEVVVSLDSDNLSCRETTDPDSQVVAVLNDGDQLTIDGAPRVEDGIARWPVVYEDSECWIAEFVQTGEDITAWLVEADRQVSLRTINFIVGDRIIVQGFDTKVNCRTGAGSSFPSALNNGFLLEDAWGTVVDGPVLDTDLEGSWYQIQVGYTDTTCWVFNGINTELEPDTPWFGLLEG